ncbi:hypothetical protein A2U01_0081006, partial [Trifolium medium]|nr:hypothetical protein [Trifolium medium]
MKGCVFIPIYSPSKALRDHCEMVRPIALSPLIRIQRFGSNVIL